MINLFGEEQPAASTIKTKINQTKVLLNIYEQSLFAVTEGQHECAK